MVKVASKVGVAWDAARKYLEHLRDIGVVNDIRGEKERLFGSSQKYVISSTWLITANTLLKN